MLQKKQVWLNKRYQLLDKIGEGGMGVVYKTHDRLTGATVALKRVTTSTDNLMFNSRGDSSNLHIALAGEFKTLASLRHPHIISVLDYGFDEQRQPFFTMEYLENAQTITDFARGKSIEEKIQYILDMLQALVYLHQHGVLHRDLKPDNVLVVDEQVKVMDFGLSLVTKGSSQTVSDAAGTMAYMAPELFLDANPSKSADLYAIGVMAYELLSGQHPFKQDNIGILINAIMNSDVDMTILDANEDVIEVLEQLLVKTREERSNNARHVIRQFCEASNCALPLETEAIRESFLQAAKFVGRDAEIQQLSNVWQDTQSGKSSTWLVGGESGVGKSRLLDELRIRALVDGALVLRGQAVSDGGRSYHLWHDVLRNLVLYSDLNDEQASILKALVTDIANLLDRDVIDALLLDPQQAQLRLFKTVTAILQKQTQPLMLVLEDLQWAGSESLALLDYLSQNLNDASILIIGNYRDDEATNLPQNYPHMQHMKIARLNKKGIAELSVSMLGEAGKQPAVISLLERETEGNVFFLVEVVRALAEDAGQIANIGSMNLPQTVFAQSIQSVVERRLKRVPASAHTLLQFAAVIGRQLDLPLLKSIDSDSDIEIWLAVCAENVILEIQDEHWQFAHDKLREGLLLDLSETEQEALHFKVAQALETLLSDKLAVHTNATVSSYNWNIQNLSQEIPEDIDRLAYHFLEASQWKKAFQFVLLAARRSLAFFATPVALDWCNKALALVSDEHISPDATILIDAYLIRCTCNWILGNFEPAIVDAETALQQAAKEQDWQRQGAALHWLSHIHKSQGHYDEAIQLAKKALAILEQEDDRIALASVLVNLGESYISGVRGTRGEGLVYLEKARPLCEAIGDRQGLAHIDMGIGHMRLIWGEYDIGNIHMERAVALGRELQDSLILSKALNDLGASYRDTGEYDHSIPFLEEALEIAESASMDAQVGYILINLGRTYCMKDDYTTAMVAASRAVEILDAINARGLLPYALTTQGDIYRKLGDMEAAQTCYELALPIAIEINDPCWTSFALVGRGFCSLSENNLISAIGDFKTAFTTCDTASNMYAWATVQALVSLTTGHLRSNELETAIQVGTEAIATAETANIPDMKAEAHYLLGIAHSRMKQWSQAQTEYNNALETLNQIELPALEWRIYLALSDLYTQQDKMEDARKASATATQLEETLKEQIGATAMDNALQLL